MTAPILASALNEDQSDLRALLLVLWQKRRIIIGSTAAFTLISAIYAFIIAKPVFESVALLLPTASNSLNSDLGAAATLLGAKKNNASDMELYQSLLTSRSVISKLLKSQIANKSDTGKGHCEKLSSILKVDTTCPQCIESATNYLIKSISVSSKEIGSGGIIEIHFTANAPWLAQEIGNKVIEIGDEELRIVRSNRSSIILERLNSASRIARSEWDSASAAYATFQDVNRSITLPNQFLEASRLQLEKTVKEQKYLLVRKEYESLRLDQEKVAPPMMVLDQASLPLSKIKPRKSMILVIGAILGAIISSFLLLAYRAVKINLTLNQNDQQR